MSTDDVTIERSPHDKENPYVMINNDLIRDRSLTPECCYLLIFLLCNKDQWKIRLSKLIEEMKGRMGRQKVYLLINEAIEAGYMLREEYVIKGDKGKNRKAYRYFLSETRKYLKKNLRVENQHAENQYAENHHSKEIPSTSSKEEVNKEGRQAKPASLSSSISKKKKKIEMKSMVHEGVWLNPTQVQSFFKKCGGDEAKIKKCYEKLSIWKIGNDVDDGKSDYTRLCNWVIQAVEKENISNPKVSKSNNTPEETARSKKICEDAEEILKSFFTSYDFFYAKSTEANLQNQRKGINQVYKYEDYKPEELKKKLRNDLLVCFPRAESRLFPNQNNALRNLMNNSLNTLAKAG